MRSLKFIISMISEFLNVTFLPRAIHFILWVTRTPQIIQEIRNFQTDYFYKSRILENPDVCDFVEKTGADTSWRAVLFFEKSWLWDQDLPKTWNANLIMWSQYLPNIKRFALKLRNQDNKTLWNYTKKSKNKQPSNRIPRHQETKTLWNHETNNQETKKPINQETKKSNTKKQRNQ